MPYTLVRTGQNPADQLAEARGLVAAHGWDLLSAQSDALGDSDPMLRPGLARALQAIADGRADGIVAVSRTAISAHDSEYKPVLRHVHRVGGFVALVRAETDL
ncbi:hypothetical protein [Streptomyces sp. NPDC048606]|uniref:hypothetical protein n=1 Tax=Streptomyces sp. NPDC048606 TaxID=3154726 RepID=UPI003418F36E